MRIVKGLTRRLSGQALSFIELYLSSLQAAHGDDKTAVMPDEDAFRTVTCMSLSDLDLFWNFLATG